MKNLQQAAQRLSLLLFALFLTGGLAGCGPEAELGQSQQAAGTHKSFILVHGAWMGGWVWDQVGTYIRNMGDTATQVTLPAHDNDPTPASSATLASYVATVANAVHAAPYPVYLVGHSMAGMVISQFAENEPTAVQKLVYFAAVVPANGQSLIDLASLDTNSLVTQNIIIDSTNGLAILPINVFPDIMCGDCNAGQKTSLQTHYRDEPLGPLGTPVTLTSGRFGTVHKTYMYTTQDQAITYPRQQVMAGSVTMDKTVSLTSSHTAQLSMASVFTDKLYTVVK